MAKTKTTTRKTVITICPLCSKNILEKEFLPHIDECRKKRDTCNICGKTFKKKEYLKKHIKNAHENQVNKGQKKENKDTNQILNEEVETSREELDYLDFAPDETVDKLIPEKTESDRESDKESDSESNENSSETENSADDESDQDGRKSFDVETKRKSDMIEKHENSDEVKNSVSTSKYMIEKDHDSDNDKIDKEDKREYKDDKIVERNLAVESKELSITKEQKLQPGNSQSKEKKRISPTSLGTDKGVVNNICLGRLFRKRTMPAQLFVPKKTKVEPTKIENNKTQTADRTVHKESQKDENLDIGIEKAKLQLEQRKLDLEFAKLNERKEERDFKRAMLEKMMKVIDS